MVCCAVLYYIHAECARGLRSNAGKLLSHVRLVPQVTCDQSSYHRYGSYASAVQGSSVVYET